MQINSSIQNSVNLMQNNAVKRAENTPELNEEKSVKTEERKHSDITPIQDELISKITNNPSANAKEELAKIDESLKKAINSDRFKQEDFSKLRSDMLKQNEEGFKSAQQVSLNQSQIAQLLA